LQTGYDRDRLVADLRDARLMLDLAATCLEDARAHSHLDTWATTRINHLRDWSEQARKLGAAFDRYRE
jgi:hypothetical protein